MGTLRPFVLFVPMSIFIAAAVASLIDLEGFFALAKGLNDWILAHFATLIVWAVFGFVLTIIGVVVSPLGKVRIGGPDAEPLLSVWQWFSITLCTTIAIGILFWAMAEPINHLYQPGGRDYLPGSEDAKDFALVSLFMHWAISPYSIYTVAGLTFALAYHNLGKPYSVSGPFHALFGRSPHPILAAILDSSILVALVMGMAASLGAGMLMMASGLASQTGLQNGPVLLAMVALGIGLTVLVSSVTGLLKGIRILSDINTRFFFVFVAVIFVFGPTLAILSQGSEAILNYAQDFIPRSLFLGEAAKDHEWAFDWTIVYFANWLAWAPVTAMFLGRIARGYTVRAFVLVNLVLPALFSMLWMSVFGVFAMETDAATDGALAEVAVTQGIEAVIFEAMKSLPMTELLVPILLCLAFISYVTAADSNTEAISQICRRHDHGPETSDQELEAGPRLKIIWVLLLAGMAWVMVAFSGVDGVRMLSNVGGLPALFIVIGLQCALIRMVFSHGQIGDAKFQAPELVEGRT